MRQFHSKRLIFLTLATVGLLASMHPLSAQTYQPAGWLVDPDCPNPNFTLLAGNTSSPVFTNTAAARGTVYASSPIGAVVKLEHPGDAISFTGRVTIAGDVNSDGNLQFRFGLYYQGTNNADTNWLGYTVGNVTGADGAQIPGLYVRNNPNPGIYSSGNSGNAMRPKCKDAAYTPGWSAGSYDISLSVTLLPNNTHKIAWKLAGVSPGTYEYAGDYTNTLDLTVPPAFDQVGMLVGAAMFQSPSTPNPNCISFKDLKVTISKYHYAP